MTLFTRLSFVGILTIILSASAFLIFSRDAAYQAIRTEWEDVNAQLSASNPFVYGTVQAVDTERAAVTFAQLNRFEPGTTRVIVAKLTPMTIILHQELTGADNVYDSFSNSVSRSLSDIQPGDRVAILLTQNDKGIVAKVILFGNPI